MTPKAESEATNMRLAPKEERLLEYLRQKCPKLNDSQIKEFLTIAGTYRLDPWKREIYAVAYDTRRKVPLPNGGFEEVTETQMSVITGYEVFLKIADQFPQYDGYSIECIGSLERRQVTKELPSRYGGGTYKKQMTVLTPKEGDFICKCTVFRKDRSHPTTAEVSWLEFAQDNQMWNSKPRIMLEKVAIARAHRLAFPNEFGGMPYISEELPERRTRSAPGVAHQAEEPKQKPLPPEEPKQKPLPPEEPKQKEAPTEEEEQGVPLEVDWLPF